jgi:hypothetical protein
MQALDGLKTINWADDVSRPCDEYTEVSKRWAVIDLVLGDTLSVRACKEQVLPKLPYEKKGYDNRVKQIVLTPWFRRLVDGLVGVVLRKEPDLTEVNLQLMDHLKDITLAGDDLQDFMRSLLLTYAQYGTVGILVDSPNLEARLRSEEVSLNIRPYWTIYHAKQIIGFKTSRVRNVRRLTQVRLSEWVDQDTGLFGVVKVHQIRTLTLRSLENTAGEVGYYVHWTVHREQEGEYVFWTDGIIETPEIPFYMAPDFSYGVPPFLQIAFMNISETRKNAELDHLLSLCANQKAVFAGFEFESEDEGETVTLGPEDGYVSDNPGASVTYVGANVQPAQVLMDRIDRIQRDMMNLAIAAMVAQKNGAETAESKRIDRIQTDSMMAVMADAIEKLINAALMGHAGMMGLTQPGVVQVNKDFSNEVLTTETARFYADLVVQGRLTVQTFFDLLIRGELLPSEFDKASELITLEQDSGTLKQ